MQSKLSDEEFLRMLEDGASLRIIAAKYNMNQRSLLRRKIRLMARLGPTLPADPVPEGFTVSKLSTRLNEDGETTSQNIQARPECLDPEQNEIVPEGHVVKGISTLLNPDGTVRAQWIKTRVEDDKFEAMVEAFIRVSAERVVPRQYDHDSGTVEATREELCTLYTMTDCHVGMLAWGKETGEKWDLDIAEKTLTETMYGMIDAAPPSAVGILNQLGDFLHFDSLRPVTPEHGHLLDADSRYQKIVVVAVRILCNVLDYMLRKHEWVHVLMNEGNHDPAGSVWMRVFFSRLYANNERVTVEMSPLPYVVYKHGTTMLGFHHGHMAKKTSLPEIFAARFRKEWGASEFVYIHTGHMHHVDETEYPGCKVIQHPTLAAADAYAARGGWLSKRQAMSVTYDKTRGEFARGIFLPQS